MNCKDCSKYKLCLYINNGNEEKLYPCKNFKLPNDYLFVSKDFIKHRPHIHYLMKYCGHNSAGVIATYNSKKNTITLKEEAFELCSVAEDFMRISLEAEQALKEGGKE